MLLHYLSWLTLFRALIVFVDNIFNIWYIYLYIYMRNFVIYTFFRAMNIECLNARWPDTFQHYRESHFTQIKHHWLWKVSLVDFCIVFFIWEL